MRFVLFLFIVSPLLVLGAGLITIPLTIVDIKRKLRKAEKFNRGHKIWCRAGVEGSSQCTCAGPPSIDGKMTGLEISERWRLIWLASTREANLAK
ncbi:hypothetical protein A3H10_00515 [Candidatus Uhrbacteria bacterium RIFCSPLOWO2_12_FULL_46_10]|uniref:Uncharacterized protein n=1 Tax=Candidatus Uhrbacteria bacterium RIFCSPLOWO2_01_FULL_47_25 TaxID=1802402 RepID=A0A1F7UTY7_9BACT|nr:MAG: hypothetical protein UX68_C0010G0035 [Parcubacteria group bacterium GW2011_GWA2_46_9]OGL59294.1 MAG: hypothetical protein A2752_01335 [Candidatus Uhrbacteria bacterium RIFCSPHIGHO2_01_FULL_46_23]OGL68461.1 MAG: hypothetical protein A3D60_02480 [Candidatus Uhrbacteria bacterium RIFCSPHIGHO2_02_FULL_47_29]OGL75611.1 MAG: hypothetical protein A3E96_01055 [Candidatus Uhrbacteria bacterium RIFCSPHIGHO2_12_FULL_46_13]OGL81127.1 MAG: hypothetical protein A2936_00820 [Candidatus Uhrbacteria bac